MTMIRHEEDCCLPLIVVGVRGVAMTIPLTNPQVAHLHKQLKAGQYLALDQVLQQLGMIE